jgi:GNAT superfamily N-acetyltransferase
MDLIKSLNDAVFPTDALFIDDKTVGWVAYNKKGEAAAFATARDIGDHILFMDRGGVLKEHRKHGLHSRLIKVRELYARQNGFKEIITYTMKDNIMSTVTLVKCGFQLYTPYYQWVGKAWESIYYFCKDVKRKLK